jgi:hypothetical protein
MPPIFVPKKAPSLACIHYEEGAKARSTEKRPGFWNFTIDTSGEYALLIRFTGAACLAEAEQI